MTCNKCGAKTEDGASICPECGEILDAVNDEMTEDIVAEQENVVPEFVEDDNSEHDEKAAEVDDMQEDEPVHASRGDYRRQDMLDEIQARRVAKRKKEQRKKIFGAIGLIIVIVGIAAGGLWVIYDQTQGGQGGIVSKPTPTPTATQKADEAEGISDAETDITARTIVAKKIHINDADEYYIEFELDDKKYFALINYGTRDDQIADRYFLVDATPADDHMCKGRVPYIINSIVRGGTADDYMIADSDKRKLTDEDIAGFNKTELKVARNEIFARHGRKFQDEALNEYFSTKSWYKADDNFSDSSISELENENAELILARENSMGE